MNIISLTLKKCHESSAKMGYTHQHLGGAVPSRPPAVLVTPFWKPPKNFSAYAPEYIM